MKKLFLLAFAFCLLVSTASAADRVTATVTITNTAIATDTFIVNGSTRTWIDTVVTPATQIATGGGLNESCTNLVNHLLAYPFSRVVVYQLGADSFRLDADTGVNLVVGGVGDYFSVTYSTQTVATAYDVIVPYTSTPSVRRQTITEGLVAWLGLASGTAVADTAASVSNLLGRARTQYVPAILYLTNAAGQFHGVVSNSPAISGTVYSVTNGSYWTGILVSPTLTNGVNYGNAFRSPGSGSDSEQFGSGALAIGDNSVALGNSADASGESTVALGASSLAAGDNAAAVGNGVLSVGDNAVAIGNTAIVSNVNGIAIGPDSYVGFDSSISFGANAIATAANQIRLGTATEHVSIPGTLRHVRAEGTNQVIANSDIGFTRYALTSLANGNNAAVPVGTNVFVQVSGPSASFTVNGLDGQPNRDGKFLILLNYTGQNMTIAHDSGVDPVAGNRIYTMTGADVATTGNGSAILIYSASASRWIALVVSP